ncbi:MAG TPA: family 10 glycosylhydrolase [Gemmatimonadaceae bacterium]|nr:family 10 glycosylhydrolase [Gemmatimonadaceae bacterium]
MRSAVFLAGLVLAGTSPLPVAAQRSGGTAAPPAVTRELRAAWIASVSHIDWPSRPGLSSEVQQDELRSILDSLARLGMNAAILQIRPAADALYASELEPWSVYLTGEQGRAPEPFYDPLAFAIEEARARGLELHAWFNPYRAWHPSGQGTPAATHISRTRPDLVRRYGRHLWLDPGEPEVQDHSVAVILDVVRRYDVDGVHIDDYFYPYRERDSAGALIDFPDDSSWARYRAGGGRLGRDDWRRDNVDRFVERLYREIKQEKAWVKFGVSPFGIWRPGHPPQIRGFDAFAEIYADARKWIEAGWVDYFAPQLYWAIGQREQSYPVLLRWWVGRNAHGRHIWPGNFTSRIESTSPPRWGATEILSQIRATRAERGATGNIHFSVKAITQNRNGIADSLATGAYGAPAAVPASRWLGPPPRARPALRAWGDHVEEGEVTVTFRPPDGDVVRRWVVRARYGNEWRLWLAPGHHRSATVPPLAGRVADEVAVSLLDRAGNEGPVARAPTGAR